MKGKCKGALLSVIILGLALAPASLMAQKYVLTNDDVSGPNSVTSFSVNQATGYLTKVGTFLTGGTAAGGYFAGSQILTSPNGKFVFAANTDTSDVSAFSIDQTTGALTLVGRYATGAGAGDLISMAITPNGSFLYAGNTSGNNITEFAVGSDGSLTSFGMVPAPSGPDGMSINSSGTFLATAFPGLGFQIGVYNISPGGALSAVPGSPFTATAAGGYFVTGVHFGCGFTHSQTLFADVASGARTVVNVFDVAPNGALSPTGLSPFQFFSGTATDSQAILFNLYNNLVFTTSITNSNISDSLVDSAGNLTPGPNSPLALAGGAFAPSGMAVISMFSGTSAITRLYIADLSAQVSAFTVANDGTLREVAGSPFPTGVANSGLVNVATDPAGGCGVNLGSFQLPISFGSF